MRCDCFSSFFFILIIVLFPCLFNFVFLSFFLRKSQSVFFSYFFSRFSSYLCLVFLVFPSFISFSSFSVIFLSRFLHHLVSFPFIFPFKSPLFPIFFTSFYIPLIIFLLVHFLHLPSPAFPYSLPLQSPIYILSSLLLPFLLPSSSSFFWHISFIISIPSVLP